MEEGDSVSGGETVYEREPVWLQPANTQTGIQTNSRLPSGGKGLDPDFNTNVDHDHDLYLDPDPNSDIDEEFYKTRDLLRS